MKKTIKLVGKETSVTVEMEKKEFCAPVFYVHLGNSDFALEFEKSEILELQELLAEILQN